MNEDWLEVIFLTILHVHDQFKLVYLVHYELYRIQIASFSISWFCSEITLPISGGIAGQRSEKDSDDGNHCHGKNTNKPHIMTRFHYFCRRKYIEQYVV
jgi:hypothetical protein